MANNKSSDQGILVLSLIIFGFFCIYILDAYSTTGMPFELAWKVCAKLVFLTITAFQLRLMGIRGQIFPFWTLFMFLGFMTVIPVLDYLGMSQDPMLQDEYAQQAPHDWYADIEVQLLIGVAILICGYKLENKFN